MVNEFLRILFLNQCIKESSMLTARFVDHRELQMAIGFIQLKCMMKWMVIKRRNRGIEEKFRNQIRSVISLTSMISINTEQYVPKA